MAKQPKDDAAPDDGDELRGGTQGGGGTAHLIPTPNATPPGGPNGGSPTGGTRPAGRTPEPPTGDKAAAERQDPYRAVEGGRTKPSPSAAAQQARDDADIPPEESRSGFDENSPRQIPEDAPTPDGRTGND